MKFQNFLLLFLVLLSGVYLEDSIPAIVRKPAFFFFFFFFKLLLFWSFLVYTEGINKLLLGCKYLEFSYLFYCNTELKTFRKVILVLLTC